MEFIEFIEAIARIADKTSAFNTIVKENMIAMDSISEDHKFKSNIQKELLSS